MDAAKISKNLYIEKEKTKYIKAEGKTKKRKGVRIEKWERKRKRILSRK